MKPEEYFTKNNHSAEFMYRLLGRMRADCEYYLNVEKPNKCPKEYNHLCADHDPEAQIAYMKYIWEALPEKPEWLTMEEIEAYERRMIA